MNQTMESLVEFYAIDGISQMWIIFFCVLAVYAVKARLNSESLVLPLILLSIGFAWTIYAATVHFALINPKRMIEWLQAMSASISIGMVISLFCLYLIARVNDRLITAAHIRRSLKRDQERASRGYQQAEL